MYRSIYQYNDALVAEGELDGLNYSQITDQYFRTELSKDSMTGSAASSSVTSSTASTASSQGDPARYDSDTGYLGRVSASSEDSDPQKQPSTPHTTTENGNATAYSDSDLSSDPGLYYADLAYKTFAQLNKKTLGASKPHSEPYGDGYENGASYSDMGSEPRSSSHQTGNAGDYYEIAEDGSSYDTPSPLKRPVIDGYEVSASPGSGYSSYSGASSYGPTSPHRRSGNYEKDALDTESGEGFRGLNQTQKRLLLEAQGLKSKSKSTAEAPLYAESQKTDFFKSFSWNERWQALLERPTMTPEEIRQRGEDIHQLTEEFLHVARPIVMRIVEELHLPDEQKTFKPVDVGGIAGGEKFMAKQLFLKYARDNIKLRLYNGDAWAQKAAIHELKSLNALIGCNIPNLHFPLMACLSCYGHYIVVVSKLPLSKNTLVYGSANVAQTIMTDREVGSLFKQAAEKLNLEPHYVVEGTTRLEKTMYGPVDIEGHKGMDGRAYIVDTARLFPPAPPIRGVRGCHLYKLLRKELVRTNPVPLSSDAFSFFGKVNAEHHNMEVKNATNRIFTELIPDLLSRNDINELLSQGNITDVVHSVGINVRFLGSLLSMAMHLPHITTHTKTCIMLEMVARASKAVFFHSMRADADQHKSKRDECLRLAAEHWNYLLFSQANYRASVTQTDPLVPVLTKEQVTQWWSQQLIPTLKQRFIFFTGDPEWIVPTSEQLEASANDILKPELFAQVLEMPAALFSRSRQLSGIVFQDSLLDAIAQQGDSFFFKNTRLLETSAVKEILILDKRVQFVPFVDIKGAGRFEDAERFYLAEIENRSRALGRTHPQVALSYRHLAELYADQRGFEEKAKTAYLQAASIIKAYHKTPSPSSIRDLSDILNLHADLYIKYDRVQAAEDTLLELLGLFRPASALQESASSPLAFVETLTDTDQMAEVAPVLDKLARVKSKMNKFQESEALYRQSCALKERVFGAEHWQVARTLNGHAQLLFAQNRLAEAKEMCLRVKSITESSRGLFHSEVGIAIDNLARVMSAELKFDDADSMLQRALEIKIKSLGEHHSFVAMTWDHMASNRFQRLIHASQAGGASNTAPLPVEDLQDIATLYERALTTIEASLGKSHSAYAITKSNLAVATGHLKQWESATVLATEALEILNASLGDLHPSVAVARANLEYLKASFRMPPTRIPAEALKMVYHAQYIASNAPERSRIPDKIRQLLEKKGLAVTEANAQKVAELLRKKKAQQTQLSGYTSYGNAPTNQSDYGTSFGLTTPSATTTKTTTETTTSTRPPVRPMHRPIVRARQVPVDGYENENAGSVAPAEEQRATSDYLGSSYGDASGYDAGSGYGTTESTRDVKDVDSLFSPSAPLSSIEVNPVAILSVLSARKTRTNADEQSSDSDNDDDWDAKADNASESESAGDTGAPELNEDEYVEEKMVERQIETVSTDDRIAEIERIQSASRDLLLRSNLSVDDLTSTDDHIRREELSDARLERSRAPRRGIVDALLSCFRSREKSAAPDRRRGDEQPQGAALFASPGAPAPSSSSNADEQPLMMSGLQVSQSSPRSSKNARNRRKKSGDLKSIESDASSSSSSVSSGAVSLRSPEDGARNTGSRGGGGPPRTSITQTGSSAMFSSSRSSSRSGASLGPVSSISESAGAARAQDVDPTVRHRASSSLSSPVTSAAMPSAQGPDVHAATPMPNAAAVPMLQSAAQGPGSSFSSISRPTAPIAPIAPIAALTSAPVSAVTMPPPPVSAGPPAPAPPAGGPGGPSLPSPPPPPPAAIVVPPVPKPIAPESALAGEAGEGGDAGEEPLKFDEPKFLPSLEPSIAPIVALPGPPKRAGYGDAPTPFLQNNAPFQGSAPVFAPPPQQLQQSYGGQQQSYGDQQSYGGQPSSFGGQTMPPSLISPPLLKEIQGGQMQPPHPRPVAPSRAPVAAPAGAPAPQGPAKGPTPKMAPNAPSFGVAARDEAKMGRSASGKKEKGGQMLPREEEKDKDNAAQAKESKEYKSSFMKKKSDKEAKKDSKSYSPSSPSPSSPSPSSSSSSSELGSVVNKRKPGSTAPTTTAGEPPAPAPKKQFNVATKSAQKPTPSSSGPLRKSKVAASNKLDDEDILLSASELLASKQSSWTSPSAQDQTDFFASSSTAASPSNAQRAQEPQQPEGRASLTLNRQEMAEQELATRMAAEAGSSVWASMATTDDAENDLAADDLLDQMDEADLEGLDLDDGIPAPHTGPSWGWGGM